MNIEIGKRAGKILKSITDSESLLSIWSTKEFKGIRFLGRAQADYRRKGSQQYNVVHLIPSRFSIDTPEGIISVSKVERGEEL